MLDVNCFKARRDRTAENCAKVIVGKDEIIELVLITFICSGHVLLEDKPGIGKTMLLRAFSKTIGGDFRRIQFTPDLLPSDLTGINFFNQKSGEFVFRPGPLFSSICSTVLKRYGKAVFRVPVTIERRGRYLLTDVTLYSGDFLGLDEEKLTFEKFNEIVIAPKEYGSGTLENVVGGFIGNISVRRFIHEDPILTAGFREYSGHEPMRMISWIQSWRGNGLMVKQYDHTMEPTASVIMYASSADHLRDADFETLCRMTRTVCRILEERGIRYDPHTNARLLGNWSHSDGAAVRTGLGSVHVLETLGRAAYGETVSFACLCAQASADGSTYSRILVCMTPPDTSSPNYARLRELSDGSLLTITVSGEEETQ